MKWKESATYYTLTIFMTTATTRTGRLKSWFALVSDFLHYHILLMYICFRISHFHQKFPTFYIFKKYSAAALEEKKMSEKVHKRKNQLLKLLKYHLIDIIIINYYIKWNKLFWKKITLQIHFKMFRMELK